VYVCVCVCVCVYVYVCVCVEQRARQREGRCAGVREARERACVGAADLEKIEQQRKQDRGGAGRSERRSFSDAHSLRAEGRHRPHQKWYCAAPILLLLREIRGRIGGLSGGCYSVSGPRVGHDGTVVKSYDCYER
jgi:hypothetical protein